MDLSEQDLYQQALYSQQQFSRSPYKDAHLAFPHLQQQPYYDLTYTPYVLGHQQAVDEFYPGYGTEYADFMYPGMGQDEFGEMEEISTRPRLTKEQVEVLESQFQANHKPNSQVKRQLAIQTKLTLPRVAVSPCRLWLFVQKLTLLRTGFRIVEPRPNSRRSRKNSKRRTMEQPMTRIGRPRPNLPRLARRRRQSRFHRRVNALCLPDMLHRLRPE